MGIFSGANDTAADTGSDQVDRPYLREGQRVVSVDKAILRKSTNESNSNTYKQWMVILEFDVTENLGGDEMKSGKAIECLQRDLDGDLTQRGKYAMGRVKGFVAAVLGVDPNEVTEEMIGTVLDPESDGTAVSGIQIIATTTSFQTKAGGTFTPTTYTALAA